MQIKSGVDCQNYLAEKSLYAEKKIQEIELLEELTLQKDCSEELKKELEKIKTFFQKKQENPQYDPLGKLISVCEKASCDEEKKGIMHKMKEILIDGKYP